MKKAIAILLVVCCAFSVFANGAKEASASDTITLKFCEQLPDGHVMAENLKYFAEQVERLSEGKIKVEVYTGGVLGDDVQMMEATKLGTIDVIRVEYTTMVNQGAKHVVATTLPYVFRDREHYWAFAASDVGQELLDSLETDGTGMVGLCYVEEGARHFFARTPLNSVSDMKGKKIRVQDTEMWVAIVKALGASATPMSFSELYTALNTGVVDGAEQPLAGYVSNKLYEVGPYMILDGHVYPTQAYVISEKTWSKLNDTQKNVLREAAKLTEIAAKESIEQVEIDLMKELKDLGVTVVQPTDIAAWQKAMEQVYATMADADTQAILKRIQAL